MKIDFVHQVPAPPAKVYAALMDPTVIQRSIDGCESLTQTAENTYATKLRAGGASVKGTVRLLSMKPSESLTLAIEGKGLPGSIKATVDMRLADIGNNSTEIRGDSDVAVGGFAAALGSKIIEKGARELIADFFARLATQITSSGT